MINGTKEDDSESSDATTVKMMMIHRCALKLSARDLFFNNPKNIFRRQLYLVLARSLLIRYYVFMKSRQNYEEKISWDQQIFAGSGIKILIVFGIRDQNFG